MELRRYLTIARRRLLLILAIVVAALAAGYFITPRDKTYTATATIYVGSRSISLDPQSRDVSGERVQGFDRLITTFTEMVHSRSVTRDAVDDSGLSRSPGAVSADITAEQVPNTNLIQVSVTQSDPAAARALANSVTDVFVDRISGFEPAGAGENEIASVYERAGLPGPDATSLLRNLALAGLFGVLVAVALVALLEYMDISMRSAEDVERQLELPVIGVVPALGDEIPVTPPATVRRMPPMKRPGTQSRAPHA